MVDSMKHLKASSRDAFKIQLDIELAFYNFFFSKLVENDIPSSIIK